MNSKMNTIIINSHESTDISLGSNMVCNDNFTFSYYNRVIPLFLQMTTSTSANLMTQILSRYLSYYRPVETLEITFNAHFIAL